MASKILNLSKMSAISGEKDVTYFVRFSLIPSASERSPPHSELARVVEIDAGGFLEHRVAQSIGKLLRSDVENGLLGRLQHDVQSAHDCERQDDVAVFVLFEAGAQQIRGTPDEARDFRVVHARYAFLLSSWIMHIRTNAL